MNPYAVPPLITAFTILSIGLFVLFKNVRSRTNKTFALFCLSLTWWLFFFANVYSSATETTALAWARMGLIGIIFIPTLAYHFVVSFLKIDRIRTLKTLYVFSLILLPFTQTAYIYRRVNRHFWGYYPEAGLFYIFLAVLFGGVFLHIILLLYKEMKKKQRDGEILRYIQIKYLFFSFVFGSVGIVDYIIKIDYVANLGIEIYPFGYAVSGIFIFLNAYAIIRYRLMDIRTVIHKTAIWIATFFLIAVPVTVLLYWKRAWLAALTPVEFFLITGFSVSQLILYFQFVQPHIDHLFQRRKYDMQQILDGMIRELTSLNNVDQMIDKLISTIQETLYVSKINLILWNEKEQVYRSVPGHGSAGEIELLPNHPFLFWLTEQDRIIERDEIEFSQTDGSILLFARSYLNDFDAKVVLPLVHDRKLIGLINLGEKRNLKPFSDTDIYFLSNLHAEASIAVSNYLLYDNVSKLSKTLLQWSNELEHKIEERTLQLSESNHQLEESNQKLREIDEWKTIFFANISHELRTPLTLILAPVDMMLTRKFGDLTTSQEKYLRMTQLNAQRLLKLTNDLLDLTKLTAGKMELNYDRRDFIEFVKGVVTSMVPLAEKKSLTLFFESDEVIPEFFFDPDKVEKVILNLVSNAVKFTEEGEIKVSCFRWEDQAFVSVSDTGVGIPKKHIGKIFGRFVQMDNAHRRKNEGTGIGLSLVKELVELHGGTVRVESQEGKGTTFLFRLPIFTQLEDGQEILNRKTEALSDLEGQEVGSRVESPQVQINGSRLAEPKKVCFAPKAEMPSILLVDDNPEMLQFIAILFQESYRILFAKDGIEGIELAKSDLPVLIISDVMMPFKDGYQLCREVKKDPATCHIPVILLTAKTNRVMEVEDSRSGADSYMTKPFQPQELRNRVHSLLNLRKLSNY